MEHRIPRTLFYQPALDGLRAVAVLLVLFNHAKIPGFAAGFVGVDMFFVLSGYLITAIIHQQMQAGEFSFRQFFARRVRRLMPVFWLFLTTLFATILLLGLPYSVVYPFVEHLQAVIVGLSNLYAWLEQANYFAEHRHGLLLPTWSLAVEEQFYLLWPLFLLGLIKLGDGALRWGIWLVIVASFILFADFGPFYDWLDFHGIYYLLPTRAWEFLLGALVALYGKKDSGSAWANGGLALLGVVLIFGGFYSFDAASAWEDSHLAILCAAVGTALVLSAHQRGDQWLSGALRQRHLVAVGLLSYSLYLWHWPILVIGTHHLGFPPGLVTTTGLIMFSVVISYLSWRWVEVPFRRHRHGFFADRSLLSSLAVGFILLMGAALYMEYRIQQSPNFQLFNSLQYMQQKLKDPLCVGNPEDIREDTGPVPCVLGAREGKPPLPAYDAILWGDSHADHYSHALDSVAQEKGWNMRRFVRFTCPPILNPDALRHLHRCIVGNEEILERMKQLPAPRWVILAAEWEAASHGSAPFWQQIGGTIEVLQEVDPSSKIMILGKVPALNDRPMECFLNLGVHDDASHCATPRADAEKSVRLSQEHFLELVKRHENLYYYSPTDALCDAESCSPLSKNRQFLYHDDTHLTPEGSRRLVPSLLQALED